MKTATIFSSDGTRNSPDRLCAGQCPRCRIGSGQIIGQRALQTGADRVVIAKQRVEPLAASIGTPLLFECDVASEESMDALFAELAAKWGKIDFLVHAIGFSDKNELRGRYVDTSRANSLMTMDISVYSFTAVCQRAAAMMNEGGSLLTLTYYGAEKVMPHYNVMGVAKAGLEASVKYLAEDLGKDGIRVNAISAGPIKTLAASGIGDFRYIMKWNELNSPLRRNVTQEEVGKASLYLLSDLGSGLCLDCLLGWQEAAIPS